MAYTPPSTLSFIFVAYCEFPSSPGKEYAYLCGGLHPTPGQLCVVQTNDNKLKVVRCIRLANEPSSTRFPYKHLFGIVTTQPEEN